jgi:[acyl-carrier-protein] S-malonyltransferase
VYWQASIERMVRVGIDTIVEIGPKRTLTNLTKRIDAGIRVANVEDLASLRKTRELLKGWELNL